MNYKEALELAKQSVKIARQQIELASNALDEFTSDNGYAMWSTLNSLQNLLFNLHYYIMDKFEENENK